MKIRAAAWALLVIAAVLTMATTPVTAQARNWCGELTSNTTWTAGQTHLVCAEGVRVRDSVLSIQAGADILMSAGASIVVQAGARLEAIGSADARVRFRSNARDEQPGFWGQIRFEPGSGPNRMDHVSAISGGSGNVPMIEVRDSILEIPDAPTNDTGVDLRGATDVPLAYSADAIGPSLEAAGNLTMDQACNNLLMSGNGVNAIGVLADAPVDVTVSQTWHSFCLPYRVTEPLTVGGPDTPELALDRGVVIHLEGEGGIVAGPDESNPGIFSSNGTPDRPNALTAASKTPGAWRGIVFTAHSGASVLSNTRVEYGGAGDVPMVLVESPDAMTIGTTFANAKGYPLALVPAAVTDFLAGVFNDTERTTPAFSGNGVQRVKVLASVSHVLDQSATWGDAGVPLEIDGDLYVGGADAALWLDAGAQLLFAGGAVLSVGERRYGAAEIVARGTADNPVVIAGVIDAPGSWVGVRLGELLSRGTFDFTVFAHGGSADVAMLDWTRATRSVGDITRCTFRGAAGHPVAVPFTLAHDLILAPDLADAEEDIDLRSTYEGNGANRVLLDVNGTLSVSAARWRDPGAPVEVAAMARISSAATPVLDLRPGLRLVFRDGAGLQLGDGGNGKASLIVSANGDDAPVTLGPVDPASGWAGVRVLSGSLVEANGALSLSGIADGTAALRVENGIAHLAGVEITGSQRGTGIEISGSKGWAEITGLRVTGMRTGLHIHDLGGLEITRSFVQGNLEWGMRNDNAAGCLRAPLVFWGARTGPRDESAAQDGCMNGANASPTGDRVSDHVDWWPYALDADFHPSPGLGPNPKKVFLPAMFPGR